MRKLLKYLKNYKAQSVLAPLFKFLEAVFELFVPIIVAAIIDNGIEGGRGASYVAVCCAILLALGIVGLVAAITAQYFAACAAVGFAKELRHDLFAKIQSLSYSQLDTLGTPKLITRMTSDVNQMQSGVNLFLRIFLRSPFIVFGALVAALIISPLAGGIFAASIAVLCVIVFSIMLVSIPLYKKSQGKLDAVTTATRETLLGARVIRAFCKEEDEIKEFDVRNEELKKSRTFAGGISALMNPLTYAVVNVTIIILLYVGAVRVEQGVLTQGMVIALYNYMLQILVELIKMANLIITVTKSMASAARVSEILDMQSGRELAERGAVQNCPYITFNNVSVSYGGRMNALSGLSFTAEKGQTIGVIGGTGAGKTTLVNLLPRFYDACSGEVLIDGQNVMSIPAEELRRRCGVVPQHAVLFKGTIRENLLWGNPQASEEQLLSAVAAAQASDVIASKQGGLDEMVEQGGKNFSGGQRQRLTIARALVKQPEILILDDSASALDYATDARLRKSLKSLDYNPTVFIVSQRTSSIRHADKIIVLEGGRAVGIGTHEELLKSCDIYREIHYSQFKKEGAA